MQYKTGDQVFGNWKLVRLIGEGSFGKVYEAQREDFGRTYKAAIKIITIPQSESELQSVQADGLDDESVTSYFRGFVEELVDEFVLMSDLKGHSHIVSYEDHTVVTHTDGIGWDIMIRMELLTPLIQHVRTNTMTQRDIIQLGIDLCKALELCQKYKIIHRDIKPENIFISPAGDFKLGDFGIARTAEKTTSGMSKKGTYTYMAPEIYRDQPYGTTVDIYSLGIVLYWLLNENRSPFLPAYPATITHSDRERALRSRMGGEAIPAPKNADGRLAEIVLKACAYNPKDRYSSPVQMRQELEAILYNQREANVIFPGGDDLPARSVHEIPTDEALDATESAFSPKQSRQQAPAEAEEEDKTESVFGARAVEKSRDAAIEKTLDVEAGSFASLIEHSDVQATPSNDSGESFGINVQVTDGSEMTKKNSLLILVLTLATLMIVVSAIVFFTDGTRICFADGVIAQEVSAIVGKPIDRIEKEDVSAVVMLDLSGKGVSDLSDLQYLPYLVELHLDDNDITNIDPISYLSNLETLTMSGCNIEDISVLANLSDLQTLDIRGNRIKDISVLLGMQNLKEVKLLCNSISQIEQVVSLGGCTTLDVPLVDENGNQISELKKVRLVYGTSDYDKTVIKYAEGAVTGTDVFKTDENGMREHWKLNPDGSTNTVALWSSGQDALDVFCFDDTGRIGYQWQLLDEDATENKFKSFYWTSTTGTDEEGIFWSYEYNEDGAFSCRRTSDMPVTWDWGDQQVSIGTWNLSPMIFSAPVENCSQFDFDFEFSDVKAGISVYGTQSVYVRSGSEQWKKIGSFNADGPGKVTTTFTFDDPISFDQLVVVHPQTGQYIPAGSFTVWYDTYNIQCISYANAGEALLDSAEPI